MKCLYIITLACLTYATEGRQYYLTKTSRTGYVNLSCNYRNTMSATHRGSGRIEWMHRRLHKNGDWGPLSENIRDNGTQSTLHLKLNSMTDFGSYKTVHNNVPICIHEVNLLEQYRSTCHVTGKDDDLSFMCLMFYESRWLPSVELQVGFGFRQYLETKTGLGLGRAIYRLRVKGKITIDDVLKEGVINVKITPDSDDLFGEASPEPWKEMENSGYIQLRAAELDAVFRDGSRDVPKWYPDLEDTRYIDYLASPRDWESPRDRILFFDKSPTDYPLSDRRNSRAVLITFWAMLIISCIVIVSILLVAVSIWWKDVSYRVLIVNRVFRDSMKVTAFTQTDGAEPLRRDPEGMEGDSSATESVTQKYTHESTSKIYTRESTSKKNALENSSRMSKPLTSNREIATTGTENNQDV